MRAHRVAASLQVGSVVMSLNSTASSATGVILEMAARTRGVRQQYVSFFASELELSDRHNPLLAFKGSCALP